MDIGSDPRQTATDGQSVSAAAGSMYSSFGSFAGTLRPNQIQSPYLSNLSSMPETLASDFIVPEGNARTRGRFELAFSQIGASIMVGSGLGGAVGTYKGIKEVSQLEAFISVKRTQFLNYVTRNGASMANTFGTIALTYSSIGVALSFVQDKNDDLNTLISAASTGALYGAISKPKIAQSSTGAAAAVAALPPNELTRLRLKRGLFGSLFGTVAACSYILYFNSDKYFSK